MLPRHPDGFLELTNGVPRAEEDLHHNGVGNSDPPSGVKTLTGASDGCDYTALVGAAAIASRL